MDYRYFPDPDLLPLEISQGWIDEVRQKMGELPSDIFLRMISDHSVQSGERDANEDAELRRDIAVSYEQVFYGLPRVDAEQLVRSKPLVKYFEDVVAKIGAVAQPKLVSNWVLGELSAAMNRSGIEIDQAPIREQQLALLLTRIIDQTVSGKAAKEVFDAMWEGDSDVDAIIAAKGLKQVYNADAIEKLVDDVINAHPKSVEEYQAGKEKAFNALFGQVMKASNKTANPAQVTEILKRKLGR